MSGKNLLYRAFALLMIATLLLGANGQVAAREATPAPAKAASNLPADPQDDTKVPHYFGPYSNWANSPQVLYDAVVTIDPPAGVGLTASATAIVSPLNGSITGFTITSPGSGYTSAPAVTISAPIGSLEPGFVQATATTTVSAGVLTAISVTANGGDYTKPEAVITCTGCTTGPAVAGSAQPSGSVDAIQLVDGGAGYSNPEAVFSMPELADGVQATALVTVVDGIITDITIDDPGSGYTNAPTLTIVDWATPEGTNALATATINVNRVDVTLGGEGYDAIPEVTIIEAGVGAGAGAAAEATIATDGAVTSINVVDAGAGYLTPGIKKFVDTLPGLGPAAKNNLDNYIPVAVKDTQSYPGSDYYEIGLVQYYHKFHTNLPPTLMRGYVQLTTPYVTGAEVPLTNAILNHPELPGNAVAGGYLGVDEPHYLGPTIIATQDRPVRIVFRNLLPTGSDGDLFLPVDTTLMGSGPGPSMMTLDENGVPMEMAENLESVMDEVRNPICGQTPKPAGCFSDNRATLHLHGGITPWISDGTPHQWITPADEVTDYPKGVSVSNVPDMPDPGPGSMTFFYTNQQSARLMFYHDHAWGITRLNVYAGEAAGYLITDAKEQELISPTGALAGLGLGTPLIIQDKTFVPSNILDTDPTWDIDRWGGEGSLWAPHVYMPAQNPNDMGGMSGYGRWMFGPWFWPPANPKYAPIANPYFDPACDINNEATWQYDIDPFCEPPLIPGTPNISVGMEAFNDTPLVNGTAYPTTTVDPKAYRFRILNAANDRFFNLSWYVADPRTGTLSEVALNPAEVEAAKTDTAVFPTPDETWSPKGPNWIVIGSEGGFLPEPVVLPAQPTTWVMDPTVFHVGTVDLHSLLIAPAERTDVIVDFSGFRNKTLILYNDAPAAFPARVAQYDYYTDDADLSPVGAPTTLPGYGPNTRTVMQVKVSNKTAAVPFDRANTTNDRLGKLMTAFGHKPDNSGVFESAQHPIIVGQAAYNSAYGTSFVESGWCNSPNNPTPNCDGFFRINEQAQLPLPNGDPDPAGLYKFDTLAGPQIALPMQPKAIHDEMNSVNFDEFGRMTANLGLEFPSASPMGQNVVLFPYVNPSTENLDSTGMPSSMDVTPISTGDDGTQIWKITHNGVDTHPIHFHLYDVQLLNRVSWDNIVMPPHPTELGWKDTVRISPLMDTYVALRPIVPTLPFGLLDSERPLNPMMPVGATGPGLQAGFNNLDALGQPLPNAIVNNVVSFGWEYVYHCHILSHEEMDMMRPVVVYVDRALPDAPVLNYTGTSLEWTDGTPITYSEPAVIAEWGSAQNEVGYHVYRSTDGVDYTKISSALANETSFTDATAVAGTQYYYKVSAYNAAGESLSDAVKSPTVVTSINRVGSTPTSAATVDFTVTFSDSVTGVDAADFVTNNTNSLTGTSVTGVTGTGTTYTVTVDTGTGSGLLRLDLVDDDTIIGVGSMPLGGTGAGNGSFNTGQTYGIRPPGAFSKSAPTAGAVSQSRNPTISWGAAADAVSYEYCYDTTNNSTCDGTWTSTGTSQIAVITGLNYGATYYWQVRAVNFAGNTEANGGTWWAFSTAPSGFNKTAPTNGQTNRPPTTTALSWAASTGATSYQYCFDTVNNNTCDGTWTSTGTNRTSGNLSLLTSTTYYWQVRAMFNGGYAEANAGTWYSFSTVNQVPGAFNKSAPSNGAAGQTRNPTISWNASTYAASYDYCIQTTPGSGTTCATGWVTNGTSRTKLLSGLNYGTTYYWQVRANNNTGTTYANTGTWWSFATAASGFNKSVPANNTTGFSRTGALYWAVSQGATSYEYCLVASPTAVSGTTCSTGWTSTALVNNTPALNLAGNTRYYWQVRAMYSNSGTYANNGTWYTFVTAP